MSDFTQQRTDLTQSFEDFARVMEDYFRVIPPEVEEIYDCKYHLWVFDDIENTMTFHFNDEWEMDEMVEFFMNSPSVGMSYHFEEFESVDRQNKTITIVGKDGGLM